MVDDVPLDMQLHQLYPDHLFLGLIPVMTEWLNTDEEKSVARTRYLSSRNGEILPILMCPDDCDFYCTLLVAEVVTEGEEIVWKRIGLDKSDLSKGVENLGENVEWLELVPVMRFRREDYVKALNLIYTLEDENI
ncbi:hypothetical protein D3C81_1152680 [compost metagenome]